MTYKIKLDVFEGPLDLLLYLIRKNEIDIYNIPIALITEQYLEYMEVMKSLNLDIAGEYLLLASTLIHIKSKMLLPVHEEEDSEEEDPREELVRQLLEYKSFKDAALHLNGRKILGRDVFGRGSLPDEENTSSDELNIEIGIFELIEAFRKSVAGLVQQEFMAIDVEQISLSEKINEIMDRLNEKKMLTFLELIQESSSSRLNVIYTFLAILELVKMRVIRAFQATPYGEVRIYCAVEKDDG